MTKKYNINNKQLSLILSDFWKYDKIDMFKNYKQLDSNKDIIIEYIKYSEFDKDGKPYNVHKFCYYWHEDKLSEIFKQYLEPAMMHKFNDKTLYSRFYNKLNGNKNKFKFNINLHNDGMFVKSCDIIVEEKSFELKPNINKNERLW